MNLRDETTEAIGQKTVLCAVVDECELKVEYTQKEYETFLSKLNFQYHRDIDEISGTVWFNDGTLLERLNNSWMLSSLHD